jgi:hypothetical protein
MGISIFGGVGIWVYLRITWDWLFLDELSLHAKFVQNPAGNIYITPSEFFFQNPTGNYGSHDVVPFK